MNMNDLAFTLAGKQYTFEAVANEFQRLEDVHQEYVTERDGLGVHFIQMMKGKDLAGFLTISTMIETAKGWKSKQVPQATKQAPAAWKQYKSNAKAFIELGGVIDETVPTVSELNKQLNAKRKEKNKEKGEDQAAETATTAIEVAAGTSQSFANMLAKLASLYGHLDAEMQAALEDQLGELVNDYKELSTSEEVEEILSDDETERLIQALEQGIEEGKAA